MTTKVPSIMLSDGAREGVIHLRGPATNGTYPVQLSAPFDYDFISVEFQTDTGTITAVVNIDGTPVQWSGGDGNLSLSSTAGNETAASAASVTAGDPVTLVLSSAASSPTLAAIDLFVRRTD